MYGTSISIRKRLTWVLILTSIIFLFLMCRLAWVQFVHGSELKQKALDTRTRDIPVEAKRGAILDRNGNELVTSISVDSIYATPSLIKNPQETASQLAPLLDIDQEKLYAKLTKQSGFEWLKRKVDNDTSKRIRELEIRGIAAVEESKRYYVHPTLAPHILGFTGTDNQGLIGIEKSYDEQLMGKAGKIITEYDAAGREVPEAIHQFLPAEPGYDLVLTIDETIQYLVEKELDKTVAQYNPKFASVIVMDPETGDILAMGNRPTFDPNTWSEVSSDIWDKNPSVWYNYEPGSTFKIVTAASALDKGIVHADDSFYDPGFIKIANHNLKCWKDGGHGSQTFAQVVQNSCNPGFAQVGLNLGKENFYQYIRDFGFGSSMNVISKSGESSGIMISEADCTNLNLGIMAIGQSIAVTPIQLITAASAIANDGMLMQPRLVKELRHMGKTVKQIQPEQIRQVIKPDTAKELRLLLESVVDGGTGSNAFVDGYRIGGKTGTAQVVGDTGGYVSGKYVASFVGMAPADDPKMVMLVVIAEPQGGNYYGGLVAAPIFQSIARDVLRYMGLPETPGQVKQKQPWETNTSVQDVTVPNVLNFPLERATQKLQAAGLHYQTSGEGDIVHKQTPGVGAKVQTGSSILLNLASSSSETDTSVTVPDLKGLTIKEAGSILEDIGLTMISEGSGFVEQQSVEPNTKVPAGTSVKIIFSAPNHDSNASIDSSTSSEKVQNTNNPYL